MRLYSKGSWSFSQLRVESVDVGTGLSTWSAMFHFKGRFVGRVNLGECISVRVAVRCADVLCEMQEEVEA